jgi:hypothetical protein
MKFCFEFTPSQGLTWPTVSVAYGDQLYNNLVVQDQTPIEISFSNSATDLKIFYHKTPNETVVENEKIVKDQCLQLNRVWVDDVLMEPWFVTEGCYFPEYFAGIKEQFPDWPQELPSQLIWHFPGTYKIRLGHPFWPWYSQQRKKFSGIQHTDKDNERWENWSGSHNAHQDLVQEIYRLLNV